MSQIPRAAIGAFWLLALSCAPMGVQTDYDPAVSFAGFRTYAWLDSAEISDELAEVSPFLERRLQRAVDRALTAKGYTEVADPQPDFLVTAFVVAPDHRPRCPPGRVCAPARGVFVFGIGYPPGLRYPYGYRLRYPWYGYRYPYVRDPWGYAYAYRVGFGYTWLPIYDPPGTQLPGTVVVDIFAAETGELIWRGSVEGALAGVLEGPDLQRYLDDIVAEVLTEFPPP